MSHSSVAVSYRPEGPGHKVRQARFDLGLIRDPEAWLARRLGPLAAFTVEHDQVAPVPARDSMTPDTDRPAGLGLRLSATMADKPSAHNAMLSALALRPGVIAKGPGVVGSDFQPKQEEATDGTQ